MSGSLTEATFGKFIEPRVKEAISGCGFRQSSTSDRCSKVLNTRPLVDTQRITSGATARAPARICE